MASITARQLRTLVSAEGTLELSIHEQEIGEPKPDEVVVRVDAAPINPSDLGLLLAMADVKSMTSVGGGTSTVTTGTIAPNVMRGLSGRVGQSMPVGNEGGGVVVAAGASDAAQALLGRTVGVLGGAMYSTHRRLHVSQCLALPEGTTPVEGAACFVNPLTALGMTETMRREGHTALVHTAAASNLGQMLQKICVNDGIQLVNIVRKPEHVDLLRSIGATHTCDSSSDTFEADLTAALIATGATIAFDAIGGGRIAGQILSCMERAANANATEYSRYGSSVHKQVYIYGGLDPKPTEFTRNFGMIWSLGGWLLTPFLQKIGPGPTEELRQRVAREITTTFASHYTDTITLEQALDPEVIRSYARMATGQKYLVTPNA